MSIQHRLLALVVLAVCVTLVRAADPPKPPPARPEFGNPAFANPDTPGLLEGTGKPDSARCIDISTRAALRTPATDLIEVGDFEVRGRKAKIKLWSLADAEQPVVTRAQPPEEAEANGADAAAPAREPDNA